VVAITCFVLQDGLLVHIRSHYCEASCHAQKGMIAELVTHITCKLGRHS
jgi:hypothetical protein